MKNNRLSPKELKEARFKVKLTQMRLAFLSGVGRFKINTYENGYHDLSQQDMDSIIGVLEREKADGAGRKNRKNRSANSEK